MGLATCALCGGGLVVETSARKRGRVPEYVCARRRLNGACANALRMAATKLDEAVLQAAEMHALTPEAIEHVIHISERDEVADLQAKLERERKDVEKRIARVVAAIETGADSAALVAKLRDLEARQRTRRLTRSASGPSHAWLRRSSRTAGRMATPAPLLHDAGTHGAPAHPSRNQHDGQRFPISEITKYPAPITILLNWTPACHRRGMLLADDYLSKPFDGAEFHWRSITISSLTLAQQHAAVRRHLGTE